MYVSVQATDDPSLVVLPSCVPLFGLPPGVAGEDILALFRADGSCAWSQLLAYPEAGETLGVPFVVTGPTDAFVSLGGPLVIVHPDGSGTPIAGDFEFAKAGDASGVWVARGYGNFAGLTLTRYDASTGNAGIELDLPFDQTAVEIDLCLQVLANGDLLAFGAFDAGIPAWNLATPAEGAQTVVVELRPNGEVVQTEALARLSDHSVRGSIDIVELADGTVSFLGALDAAPSSCLITHAGTFVVTRSPSGAWSSVDGLPETISSAAAVARTALVAAIDPSGDALDQQAIVESFGPNARRWRVASNGSIDKDDSASAAGLDDRFAFTGSYGPKPMGGCAASTLTTDARSLDGSCRGRFLARWCTLP